MNKCRKLLVDMIKATGQEIIDRAEQMVDEDSELISDFSIHCKFDQGDVPVIEWTTEVINSKAFKVMRDDMYERSKSK